LRDLPEGIVIEPGRLAIVFASTQELLVKLFELARAAANEFEKFDAAVSPRPGGCAAGRQL
jgi:hypothetical protein